jgi:hypothetical protein
MSKVKNEIFLVSFAQGDFYEKKRKLNTFSAKYIGGFSKVFEYTKEDIDTNFLNENKTIFDVQKGAGLWLWKPYFISKTLEQIEYGDYLFHCDTASFFIRNMHGLVNTLEESGNDLMLFALPLQEKNWTCPSVANYFSLNETELNSAMITASYFLIKKTKKSELFIKEWLTYCTDYKLINGSSKKLKTEYPDFRNHRYDQSLLSICAKKAKLELYRDPSQYGKFPEMYRGHSSIIVPQILKSTYKTSIILTRKANSLIVFLKYLLKVFLSTFFPNLYKRIIKDK